jgi:hypothetical protein
LLGLFFYVRVFFFQNKKVYVADVHAHFQRTVLVVKMATVLEEFTTEEQRSVVRLVWAKGLNGKDIHKDMFPVYGGKCLTRKAVHIGVEKFSQGRSKVADDAGPGAEVADFHAAGFDTLVKRWDKCINIAGGYIEK